MDTQKIYVEFQSNRFKKLLMILGLSIIAFVFFFAGMQVGYIKASFNYHLGESYYRSFGPGVPHVSGFIPNDMGNAHGAAGTIVSINLPSIVIADDDNTEKIVHLSNSTLIREMRSTIFPADLLVGDHVVIIGRPDEDAEVEASFIRVMSKPDSMPVQLKK